MYQRLAWICVVGTRQRGCWPLEWQQSGSAHGCCRIVLIAVGGRFWGSYPPQNTPVEPEVSCSDSAELQESRWVAADTDRAESGRCDHASGQRDRAGVWFGRSADSAAGARLQVIGPTILEPRERATALLLTLGAGATAWRRQARSKGLTVLKRRRRRSSRI